MGCPTCELGSVGRGHGSVLDPDEVARWQVAKHVPVVTQDGDNRLLDVVAQALIAVLKLDDLARRIKVTDAQAALCILIIFERVYRNVRQEPLTREKIPIQLMQLCIIHLDSVERGIIHRRNAS